MSTTTETGDTPILDTRIPEHRAVEGLEYGAHVSRPGWTGYHVRAGTCPQWGIVRQTPADNELVGDDREIADAIARELEALELAHAEAVAGRAADRFAAAMGNDGQRFETPEGTSFEALAERMGAGVEVWREYSDGTRERVPRSDVTTSDPVRYVFPDGSVIVAHGDAWDHEGDAPGTRRG